jgi:hypothetical protein
MTIMKFNRLNIAWIIIGLLLVLFCFESFGQAICSQDSLLNVKGSWNRESDWYGLSVKYPATDVKVISQTIDKIKDQVYDAYPNPKGMYLKWNRAYEGTPPLHQNLECYAFSMYLMELYCDRDKHKVMPADETMDVLGVHVNYWGNVFYFDTTLRIGKYVITWLPYHVGKVKGFDLFRTSNVRMNSAVFFICRPGQSIYIELTRKQYLLALKAKLQRDEKYQIDRSNIYSKTEQQRASSEKWFHDHIDPQIKIIDDYIAKSSENDLAQTACIWPDRPFKDFTTEDKGGQTPVIINKDYFANAPKNPYTPQFMVISWTWQDGEGPAGGILRPKAPDMDVCCKVSKFYKESIEQKLDLVALQQMLDK